MEKQKVFVVSVHLPVDLVKKDGVWSFTWRKFNRLYPLKKLDTHDVWFVGFFIVDFDELEDDDLEVLEAKLNQYKIIPCFIQASLFDQYYTHFCKMFLWPLLHSLTPSLTFFPKLQYAKYREANRKMAEKLVEVLEEGDMIWVHDYHLMLLPSLLRKKLKHAQNSLIGFSFHTPFPSSDNIMTLPPRDELMRGLLSATIVSFHIYDFSRHFQVACRRVLQVEACPTGVWFNGRFIVLYVCHIGIDPSMYQDALAQPKLAQHVESFQQRLAGRKLIMGGVKTCLDPVKGLDLKLRAFDVFLTNFPEWKGKVVLFQALVLPKSEPESVAKLKAMADGINQKHGGDDYTPVMVHESPLCFADQVAVLSITDLVFVTSVRDGANLLPYEYSVCRGRDKPAPLVLSQFSGPVAAMSCCLRVNPWDIDSVAASLNKALLRDNKRSLLEQGRHYDTVLKYTTQHWAKKFLSKLHDNCSSEESLQVEMMGFGSSVAVGYAPSFEYFVPHHTRVVTQFNQSKTRLILLNYDGTIRPSNSPSPPDAPLLDCLRALSADPSNFLYIISDRVSSQLESWFGSLRVGIVSESGYQIRHPGDTETQTFPGSAVEKEMKELVRALMESCQENTDGSYIFANESSIAWCYGNADPDFASFQGKELHAHLLAVLNRIEGLCVVQQDRKITVRLSAVNKGSAVNAIMSHPPISSNPPDLVMCFGDEESDEVMFEALAGSSVVWPNATPIMVTATVIKKPSLAQYFFHDVHEVRDLLFDCANG